LESLVFFVVFVVYLKTMEAGRSEVITLLECSLVQVLRRILKRRVRWLGPVHNNIISKIGLKILYDNEITVIVRKCSENWPGKVSQNHFYINPYPANVENRVSSL
jgi:hypothetical protein